MKGQQHLFGDSKYTSSVNTLVKWLCIHL